jgi:hypothetical protein
MFSWLMDAVLSSIPAWMWLVGAGTGLVAFFFASIFSHFPPVRPYMMLVKPLGGLAALVCVFMYGGSGVQAMWEEKVRIAQEEADRKAVLAEQLNKDLDKERKKKAEVRVEYRDRIKTEIKEVEKIIDAKCEIDPKVLELLNKAATNPEKAK